jgi:protein-tyrosine phosphatase
VSGESQKAARRPVAALRGPFNFRDLGGAAVRGGHRVRMGVLFRGASLHRFSAERLPAFRTVIDLRSPGELTNAGEFEATTTARVLTLPMMSDVWDAPDCPEEIPVAAFLGERYVELLELGRIAIASAVSALGEYDALPAVFFCAAGKDRTGVMIAVLLALLGVADEDIVADYVASERPLADFADWLAANDPTGPKGRIERSNRLLGCPPEAMQMLLNALRANHQGADRYLLASGVVESGLARLRERLVV